MLRFDVKDWALASVFAALYAALVVVQGVSAAASVQLRFADCLIPLCALFGWPVVLGVSVGAFVGNAFTSLPMANGFLDVFLGPLANLLAGVTIYLLRRRRFLGCVLASVEIGVIVGSYVWLIFGAPGNVFGFGVPLTWPFWFASVVSITVSSLVAIAVVGYALVTVLGRSGIGASLRARGLKTVTSICNWLLQRG